MRDTPFAPAAAEHVPLGTVSRLARIVACCIAAGVVSCGGPQGADPTFAIPDDIAVDAEEAELAREPRGATLDERVADLVAMVERRDVVAPERFDLDEGFALVTWSTLEDERRLRHLALVAEGEWTVARENALLAAALDAPSGAGGAPYVHVFAQRPLPYAVEYLFGNAWWGALESELFVLLSQGDPSDPEPFVRGARDILRRYGVDVGNARHVVTELDTLLRALPAPDADSDYRPVATLAGIGLVLGDAIRNEHGGLVWVPAEDAMAEFHALEVAESPGTVLRPLDYAMRAWRSEAPAPLAAYADLVGERLDTLRDR